VSGDIKHSGRIAWQRALLVGAIYFVAASATIVSTRFGGGVAMLWIATAILLAELSLSTTRHWVPPLVTCGIASFIATSLFGFGITAAIPLVAINLTEAVIGAVLLRRLHHRSGPLATLHDVGSFVIAAGIVAPALTAFGGASVATALGGPFWSNWLSWFAGHALGTIAFAPIVASVMRSEIGRSPKPVKLRPFVENAIMIVLIATTDLLVFAFSNQPLLFLPILVVMVATIWRGQFGAGASIIMLALIGGSFTIAGIGPIRASQETIEGAVLFFQFYLAVTVLTVLPVAADLTRRKVLHKDLLASEARYRLVTENSSDLILNLDLTGRILYASQASGDIDGNGTGDLIGKYGVDLVLDADREATQKVYSQAVAHPDQTFTAEYRGFAVAGETRWFETRCRGVIDNAGQVAGVVSSIRDISDRKRLEAQLAHEAATDFLTGLPNRRTFMRRLQGMTPDALNRAPGCVAIVDLDHFKAINDRYGHQVGDQILKRFAQCALNVLRGVDVVARIGGEEFGLIFHGANIDQATAICERLRSQVEATDFAKPDSSSPIHVTISAGVAELGPDSAIGQALAAADAALYRAKAAGRNRLVQAA